MHAVLSQGIAQLVSVCDSCLFTALPKPVRTLTLLKYYTIYHNIYISSIPVSLFPKAEKAQEHTFTVQYGQLFTTPLTVSAC